MLGLNIYIYTHHNKLQVQGQGQFTRPDALFKTAFGGKIPATYYVSKNEQGKQLKMLMNRAILSEDDGGLDQVSAPMNTFDVISAGFYRNKNVSGDKDSFNPDKFNVWLYQNIAAANYFSVAGLDDAIFLAEDTNDQSSLKMYEEIKNNLSVQNAEDDNIFRNKMLEEHNYVKETSLAWKEYRKNLAEQQENVIEAVAAKVEKKPARGRNRSGSQAK